MSFFDFPLGELETYRPSLNEPHDFDEFWADTLAANALDTEKVQTLPMECDLETVSIFDVRFPGFEGQPVAAWLVMPKFSALEREGKLPAVVQYVGYGGGRGLPEDHLGWASAGYASFIVDTRGQGGTWGSGGDTPDYGDPSDTTGSHPGVMTRGVRSPKTYYYRRLFVDAVNAVSACSTMTDVDDSRIYVAGGSQAGALSLVAAALNPRVSGALINVPFLCNFERAVGLTDAFPYQEIVEYLSVRREEIEQTFQTLSYFDAVSFAKRANCPALFSVALMDQIAPPSTVFAAKNWYGGQSQIEVYPYNGHEGGGTAHWRRELKWLRALAAENQ